MKKIIIIVLSLYFSFSLFAAEGEAPIGFYRFGSRVEINGGQADEMRTNDFIHFSFLIYEDEEETFSSCDRALVGRLPLFEEFINFHGEGTEVIFIAEEIDFSDLAGTRTVTSMYPEVYSENINLSETLSDSPLAVLRTKVSLRICRKLINEVDLRWEAVMSVSPEIDQLNRLVAEEVASILGGETVSNDQEGREQ